MPLPPAATPANPMEDQMRDPAVTLGMAIDLALMKAEQFEADLGKKLQQRFLEMEHTLVRLCEAAFWCNQLQSMIERAKQAQRAPGIEIVTDLPDALKGKR